MTVPLLEIDNLVVKYGGVTALRGVSLRVDQGEVVALLGANGAGKSTLVRAVSGLIGKVGGIVRFAGNDITKTGASRIVGLGLIQVPEGREIFSRMTVRENLLMGAYRFGAPSDDAMADVLALFPRLHERLDQRGGSLSGGEQQMLAIARGLLAKPNLLVLDEPSLGLAPKVAIQMFEILAALAKRGITILLAEQSARLALELADRAYVLANGRIHTSGNADELAESPEIIDAYLGGQRLTT